MKVETRSRCMVIDPLNGAKTNIFLHVEVECPECGGYELIMHGPHIRTLHHILGDVIEQHPELCGQVAEVAERAEFEGVCDPRKARDN